MFYFDWKKKKLKSDPDWIRTNDPQLRRLLLYPTELRDRLIKKSRGGKIRTCDLLVPNQAR